MMREVARMICESGMGEPHWMRVAGSVYVRSVAGSETGEVVACRRCAEDLAADPTAVRVHWGTDEAGDPTLLIVFPPRASRRVIPERR
jgi:hypothetical protein